MPRKDDARYPAMRVKLLGEAVEEIARDEFGYQPVERVILPADGAFEPGAAKEIPDESTDTTRTNSMR